MMKIGIITDIHSNFIALDAMVDFLINNNCNEIICAGDIIGIGPFPEETVKRLRSLNKLVCVMGNHDEYLLQGLNMPYPDGMSEGEALQHIWQHDSLSEDSKYFIKRLPQELELERGGLSIFVKHYPNDYNSIIQEPKEDDCRKMFKNVNKDIYIYGHNHRTSIVKHTNKIFINCGSLGCPHINRGNAKGGVLTIEDGMHIFEEINVEYDFDKVIREIDFIKYSDYQIIKKIFYGVS